MNQLEFPTFRDIARETAWPELPNLPQELKDRIKNSVPAGWIDLERALREDRIGDVYNLLRRFRDNLSRIRPHSTDAEISSRQILAHRMQELMKSISIVRSNGQIAVY